MRLLKADHKTHNDRHALLLFPRTLSYLDPSHSYREVVVWQLFPDATGAGDHCCCHRHGGQTLVGPARHASNIPLQEVGVSGPPARSVDGDLFGGVLMQMSKEKLRE